MFPPPVSHAAKSLFNDMPLIEPDLEYSEQKLEYRHKSGKQRSIHSDSDDDLPLPMHVTEAVFTSFIEALQSDVHSSPMRSSLKNKAQSPSPSKAWGTPKKRLAAVTPLVPLSPQEYAKTTSALAAAILPESPQRSKKAALSRTPSPISRKTKVLKAPSKKYKADEPKKYNWSLTGGSVAAKNLYWEFQGARYNIHLIGRGDFHEVYAIEAGRNICMHINTPTPTPTPTQNSLWTKLSLRTEDVVLRILSLEHEKERIQEIEADRAIDLHCAQYNIPFVTKVTSFVPGMPALPSDYVNPEDPLNQAPILGWELCARVATKELIPGLCKEIQKVRSMAALLDVDFEPGSKEHLFQWLLGEWKAYVAHMIQTRVVKSCEPCGSSEQKQMSLTDCLSMDLELMSATRQSYPLGKPRVGDFLPRNIGYDRQRRAFVYIDLKLEEDAEDALNESLTGFLGSAGSANTLRQEVVSKLYEHAVELGAPSDFLRRFQESILS